jgi:hypothetical protein
MKNKSKLLLISYHAINVMVRELTALATGVTFDGGAVLKTGDSQ